MPIETLTELQYSQDRKGPWKLYIYEKDSEYHRGGVWFEAKPKYPEEEMTTQRAADAAKEAFIQGREIRVCDGRDMLVFHSKGDRILFGENFWEEALKQ